MEATDTKAKKQQQKTHQKHTKKKKNRVKTKDSKSLEYGHFEAQLKAVNQVGIWLNWLV